MSWLSFNFILIALVTLVAGQILLKKAMDLTSGASLRHGRFVRLLSAGIALMTVSFFLTLGLLQRFDLSYLYPFQGFSVILIAITAAAILREKLTAPLIVGALLISAGIVLVSMS